MSLASEIFPALKKIIPGSGGELQLTDKVFGVRLSQNEQRYDIGNFDSYFRSFVEFALADEKYGAPLRQYLKELI